MFSQEIKPHGGLSKVCKKFRCLGYIDEKGVWRDKANSAELKDVIGGIRFDR